MNAFANSRILRNFKKQLQSLHTSTMKFESNKIYHIFNQGNNQETIFLEDAHFLSFMKLYQANIALHCETIAWCLMSNHFHFLIFTDERCMHMIKQGGLLLDPITNGFRKALFTRMSLIRRMTEVALYFVLKPKLYAWTMKWNLNALRVRNRIITKMLLSTYMKIQLQQESWPAKQIGNGLQQELMLGVELKLFAIWN